MWTPVGYPTASASAPAENILIQSTENLSCAAAAADSESDWFPDSEAARTENRAGF